MEGELVQFQATRLGRWLRDRMIQELNSTVGDIVANSAPEHIRRTEDGKATIKVPANGLREQAVYARGKMDQMERLLALFFGGVP